MDFTDCIKTVLNYFVYFTTGKNGRHVHLSLNGEVPLHAKLEGEES